MTVVLTSPVQGLNVGDNYTGTLESWLVVNGYAKAAAPVAYADTFAISPAPVAAAVEGSADAVNIVAAGALVVEVDGHNRYTIALAAADTPAAVVTKVNAAIGAVATASLNAGNFRLASDSTGSLSSVRIISGTGSVLANLFLTAGQFDRGEDGNDNATDYTGDVTIDGRLTLDAGGRAAGVLPVSDPTVAANREDPKWPATDEVFDTSTLANAPGGSTNSKSNPTYTIDGNADGDTID
ncbi:hypothetical protein J2S40_001138 [Nocardioides luteus]|uniref:MBG domain-containing protein n=1 Tax=Nocardioides luteus TaxID=1844 RepID=A0ABQ5STA2_9ACTN|nr:hypothetical protein [Nocardioides luteus]MDR7310080.1 hypothetical protein [Nocardioides luteus]GGR64991.1 hypothetical protein GCM10010197_35500 [Nocardioides luteus]GLJ67011.1 hypothetical protein GCM10017579_10470 [Nocardioides luteus]